MTRKLIPVQLPLAPKKAHLYVTRGGENIKSLICDEKTFEVFCFEVRECGVSDEYFYFVTENEGLWNTNAKSVLDITHEYAEEPDCHNSSQT